MAVRMRLPTIMPRQYCPAATAIQKMRQARHPVGARNQCTNSIRNEMQVCRLMLQGHVDLLDSVGTQCPGTVHLSICRLWRTGG
eukprot:364682-Chlamydomonas_euryale.AAC.5